MIEQVLVARLLATPAVTAIVGARIAPVVLRQATADATLVYQRIYGQRSYSLTGAAGWVETQVQFTCWSASYSEARTLADEVRQALDLWASDADGVHLVSINDGADTYAEDLDMMGATVLVTVRHEEV
jgi:hypothetical protein